jgi:tRNA-dihydrouridine synthase
MRNPWLFSQIIELAAGRPIAEPTAAERSELIERHMAMMVDYYADDGSAVHMLKKYLCAYATHMRGAVEFRDRINRSSDLDCVVEDAREFFRAAA